jgi:hypothetical protein
MNLESLNGFDNIHEIRFESDRRVKIADTIYALIFGSAIFLLNALLAFILSLELNDLAKLPVPVIISIVAIFFFLGLYCCWKLVCSKLRFCLIFTTQHIQVGRGCAKCRFIYEDVDLINGHLTNDGGCVRLNCGWNSARVYLPSYSLIECVKLLRRYCNNAVFVDFQGKEYLPQNPTRPAKTLTALEGHYRRKCLFFLLMTILFILIFANFSWELWQWWQGKLNPDAFKKIYLMRMILVWPLFPILGIFSAIYSWKSWQTANEIYDKRVSSQDATHPEIL